MCWDAAPVKMEKTIARESRAFFMVLNIRYLIHHHIYAISLFICISILYKDN
jgi:hypothetical protein